MKFDAFKSLGCSVAALPFLLGPVACTGEATMEATPPGRDGGAAGRADSGGAPVGLPEVCGADALTQWEQMMLDAHNRWRGSVEPPAANMYRVHWDRSIAQNAVGTRPYERGDGGLVDPPASTYDDHSALCASAP